MRRTHEPTETPGLVTQVLAVDRHVCGLPVALTDCHLDDAPVIWSRARVVSRVSRSHQRRFLLVRRPGTTDITETTDVVLAWLPNDLRAGDVLSLPARVPLVEVARHTLFG